MTPLADLVARTPDPPAVIAAIHAACAAGPAAVAEVLRRAGGHESLTSLALTHAGVASASGPVQLGAVAGALDVVLEQRAGGDVTLALTVPPFLATAFDTFRGENPAVRTDRTAAAVAAVAASARNRLVIAAPYLTAVGIEDLLSHVKRVTGGGGQVIVITRGLSPRCPTPSADNLDAVAALRATVDGYPGGSVRVSSWEEDGLGVHLKAVVADACDAYLGSANLTGPGRSSHAEAGVRLPPRLAGPLAAWLNLIADELDGRRGLAGTR